MFGSHLRLLTFNLLASVTSAIVFGTMPAFQATRVDLNATLKDGKGTVPASAQSRIGKSLVVAQVALSLMLMVAAGLFVRTLINLQQSATHLALLSNTRYTHAYVTYG